MASKKKEAATNVAAAVSSSTEQLLLAALARGDDAAQTGRFLISYREDAGDAGIAALRQSGMRIADARDFDDQAVGPEDTGDAEVLVFPEIGVALIGGDAAAAHGLTAAMTTATADGPIETIEPEYFVSADGNDYLRGFLRATEAIARDLDQGGTAVAEPDEDAEAEVLGATWGLRACRVPTSSRNGIGIKVAVLDTGLDLGHPDFAGRPVISRSFVGQPVQDLNGHGTHCMGTAAGTRAPAGTTPRYGIAFGARLLVGKVLTNSGNGTGAGVLAGMNWAIANRCEVISMSLGSQSPPQAAYTAAGAAALRHGLLIVAAAGNSHGGATGAPANSPTILSVASLDANLRPSSFSSRGKVELAAPGRDVLSSWPRPRRYHTISGTSMATPHVAGCAALWAQTNPALRGMALWRRLQASARRLPFPAALVGAGLVQAPQ